MASDDSDLIRNILRTHSMRLRAASVVIFLIACQGNTEPIEQEPLVHKTLLFYMGASKANALVVREKSVTGRQLGDGFERLGIKENGVKKSFELINAEPTRVPWKRVDIQGLTIASDEQLAQIFRDKRPPEQNWKAFYRQYPDASGLIGVSRVGFNFDAAQAVVYIEIGCGGLCGNGYIAHLQRGMWGWKVQKLEHLWIS